MFGVFSNFCISTSKSILAQVDGLRRRARFDVWLGDDRTDKRLTKKLANLLIFITLQESCYLNQISAMGKVQPIVLPSKTFTSTSRAGLFLKEMLGRYRDEDQITPSDSQLLFEFLQRHPEAEQKIGVGIAKFFKRRSPDFPTSGFHIERLDGSTTDFAIKACLSGQKPTLEIYFYRACRSSISHYLTSLKNELFTNGPVYCQKTGRQTEKETSEYRHTVPAFREIVEEFKGRIQPASATGGVEWKISWGV
ncbi:MAG: DCL family protein [Luteolibacter sp.]